MTQERPHRVASEAEPHEDGGIGGTTKQRSVWLRLLFMIIVAMLYGLSRVVVVAVACLQFCWVLFSAKTNPRLHQLGESLASYTSQAVRYLTFGIEKRPFPFDQDWPDGPVHCAPIARD